MLFSKLFSVFAVFAFGVASALALPTTGSSVARHARPASDVQGLNFILLTLHAKVVTPVAQLRAFTAGSLTISGLDPIVASLNNVIADAVKDITVLTVSGVDASGNITTASINALGDTLNMVFAASGDVLQLGQDLGNDTENMVVPLLQSVGTSLTQLVEGALQLTGNATSTVVATLQQSTTDVLDTVIQLATSLLKDLDITVSTSS